MLPDDKKIFYSLNDSEAALLTLYLEARNQGKDGIAAVATVIVNRAEKWKRPIMEICFQPKQFSCYNATDPQYQLAVTLANDIDKALRDKQFDLCKLVWDDGDKEIEGQLKDCLYYRVIGSGKEGDWFDNSIKSGKIVKVCEIHQHEFFKEAG